MIIRLSRSASSVGAGFALALAAVALPAVAQTASPAPAPTMGPSAPSTAMPVLTPMNPPPGRPIIPPGTKLTFHVTAPISSVKNTTKSGSTFQFVMIDPVVVGGETIVSQGAQGTGTVLLSGHAGNEGHEGDITLRIDTVAGTDGRLIAFNDQHFEVNGPNRKVASGVLGFVPFAGAGAFFIPGKDITIDQNTPINTVLLQAATVP
jgi:hypothetical protein